MKETATDFWFTVEPYVYVGLTNQSVLLYNTLDGVTIESDKTEVLELLHETLQPANCGVVLLSSERFKQTHINTFIGELRAKFMGDVIDVTLSQGKPVQVLPFFNILDAPTLNKINNSLPGLKKIQYLSEISIHVDRSINITNLIPFLQSLQENLTVNIVGDLVDVANYSELL